MSTEAEGQPQAARPTGEAAYKAHLDDVDKRNVAARKRAAEQRSRTQGAAIARARQLKGD